MHLFALGLLVLLFFILATVSLAALVVIAFSLDD